MHKIEIDMRVSKTGIFCCFNMNSNINIIYTVSLITVITNANDSCNVKKLKMHFKIIILLMNFKKNQIEPSLFAQQSALKHPILSSYIPIN